MIEEQKIALHSDELERSVLSNLLTYAALLERWQEVLNEDLFYNPKNKALFKAVKSVYDEGDTPDMQAVCIYLMKNPDSIAPEAWEVAEIAGSEASSVSFEQNIETLADLAKRRRYWLLGHRLMSAGTDYTVNIDEVDKEIDGIREENLSASHDVYDMKAVNQVLTERIASNLKDERATMIPTGFSQIDEKGGFQLTDFDVIGAATSQGKTTLAINILYNAAKQGVTGMFFSLEMTVAQLAARINAPLCGISSGLMLFKKLYTDQVRRIEEAKAITDSLPIFIDDSTTSYEKIKEKIRANAIKRGVKFFIIDYLQILTTSRSGRESEASFFERVSRELKNLAKELKVCIVALSQMNRQANDADPRPTLSKLKASGGIEQAADTVLMLYRPGYYGKKHRYRPDLDANATSEVIIGKGRNIGVGSFYVGFKAELSQFYDLEPSTEDVQQTQPQAEQTVLPF